MRKPDYGSIKISSLSGIVKPEDKIIYEIERCDGSEKTDYERPDGSSYSIEFIPFQAYCYSDKLDSFYYNGRELA
ncbi:MAG: hypothetical protein H0X31_00415 [Nostocaceae cyanobacterium]|nr:hypothetical protein [Nostocaceae cyanobacterium]